MGEEMNTGNIPPLEDLGKYEEEVRRLSGLLDDCRSNLAKSQVQPDRSEMMEYLMAKLLRLEMKVTRLHRQHLAHAKYSNPEDTLDEVERVISRLKEQVNPSGDPWR
jgi:hypothetical protein